MRTSDMRVAVWKGYGECYRRLLKLGLPVLVTQCGIIVVSFADTMMVGRYGTNELASAAFVNSIFIVLTVMQIGFAAGLTPLIGALFGRNDSHGVGRTLKAGLHLNAMISVVFMLLSAINYFFLDLYGQDPELMPLIREYYLIILLSLLPMALFNTFQQTCNGVRDTVLPMAMILIANVLNILGNYVLINGEWGFPELGLAGAGYSTLAARVFGALGIIFCFFSFKKYRRYRSGFNDRTRQRDNYKLIWKTSYPVMIQSGVECAMWAFGGVVCGWYSKIQLAAYQVVNTISQLGFMTYMSFGTATSILVANHTGIEDHKGVRKITSAGLHLILLLATAASTVFIFGGSWLIHVFTTDEAVALSALGLIVPLVVYQYMDAVQLTYANAIRGTSHVQPLLWVSVFTYIVVGIPVLLWFAKIFVTANSGAYWSFCIVLAMAALLLGFFFFRIVRKMTAGKLGNSPAESFT